MSKTTKPRFSNSVIAIIGFLSGAALFILFTVHNSFILYPSQKQLLTSIERQFLQNEGMAKLGELSPESNWDEVCVVPAYAYIKKPENIHVIRQFLGSNYQYNFFTTPDPLAGTFGLGFAFIEDGELEGFSVIPSPYSVQVPEHTLNGKALNQLYFSDLNVRPEIEGRYCYPRSTAFMRFNSHQDITIGG